MSVHGHTRTLQCGDFMVTLCDKGDGSYEASYHRKDSSEVKTENGGNSDHDQPDQKCSLDFDHCYQQSKVADLQDDIKMETASLSESDACASSDVPDMDLSTCLSQSVQKQDKPTGFEEKADTSTLLAKNNSSKNKTNGIAYAPVSKKQKVTLETEQNINEIDDSAEQNLIQEEVTPDGAPDTATEHVPATAQRLESEHECKLNKSSDKERRSDTASKVPTNCTYELICGNCKAAFILKMSQIILIRCSDIIANGVGIYCPICNLNAEARFVKVSSDRSGGREPLYRCRDSSCDILVKSLRGLAKHMTLNHPTEEFSVRPPIQRKKRNKRLKCEFPGCTIISNHSADAKKHMAVHEPNAVKKCKCNGCRGIHVVKADISPPSHKLQSYDLQCLKCETTSTVRLKESSANQYEKEGITFQCPKCSFIVSAAPITKCDADTTKPTSEGLQFPCPKCDIQMFTRLARLTAHMQWHSTETVTCELCDQVIRNHSSKRRHKDRCPALQNPCNCDICGALCRNEYHLVEHKRRRHAVHKFMCELCPFTCSQNNKLQRHRVKHGFEYHAKQKTPQSGTFSCDQCGQEFAKIALLQQHKTRVHISKNISCDQCGKMFKTMYQLTRHKHRQHDLENRRFTCDECNKKFCEKSELEWHVAREHRGELLTCELCPKQFKSKQGLLIHKKKHSNVESFSCDICSRNYTSKLGFSMHMQNKHSMSE